MMKFLAFIARMAIKEVAAAATVMWLGLLAGFGFAIGVACAFLWLR